MPMTQDQLIDEIGQMSVLDLANLVKALEERFGVSASAAPMMVAGPGAGGAAPVEEEQEQTAFDVVLTSAGGSKIAVIKVIRAATGLGLKEAKAVADDAPAAVKEGITREEADRLRAELEEAGATVEIR